MHYAICHAICCSLLLGERGDVGIHLETAAGVMNSFHGSARDFVGVGPSHVPGNGLRRGTSNAQPLQQSARAHLFIFESAALACGVSSTIQSPSAIWK